MPATSINVETFLYAVCDLPFQRVPGLVGAASAGIVHNVLARKSVTQFIRLSLTSHFLSKSGFYLLGVLSYFLL